MAVRARRTTTSKATTSSEKTEAAQKHEDEIATAREAWREEDDQNPHPGDLVNYCAQRP